MTASLRGYQGFGAKFALVQERVIIGDEMGLGKTLQALAAMAHLASGGATHFLVVCPASVVVNWTREIAKHTRLTAYRLHYAKNPEALRTKAVRAWAGRTGRVVFLTGTPMENRVLEFRSLVDHLRPEIARGLSVYDGVLGSDRFRRAIAPVYLRRNQDDVLTELPPRLETEEWVSLVGKDRAAYRDAVYDGNFMAMRRAAFAPGNEAESAKLRRLLDLADEATAYGRKVVVFSFFRDVLAVVAAALVKRPSGMDQRMLEVIGVKRAEFDAYARRSDLKDVTPDAVDVSDLAAAGEVVQQVESERRIIDGERRRLRMEEEGRS